MSDLNFKEKLKLEKLFEMESGYVLDFSDRTFYEFFIDTMDVDIYDSKYNYASGSKANRLRSFWNIESNYKVGVVIDNLLEYWLTQTQHRKIRPSPANVLLYDEGIQISKRLKSGGPVENLEAIQAISDDRDFILLSKSIRECIEKNEPEVGLDRLHTFVVKYIRELCEYHKIIYDKNTPLHSLFGSYVKFLTTNKVIESSMTEKILKSSISVLEAFNDVRNNSSFAHDNPILNYNESILIFNDVCNLVTFIKSIEDEKRVSPDNNLLEGLN